MARAQGFKQLWDGAEIAPHYPGVVAAARADWLGQNEAAARAYVGALKAANEWAARPENHAAARAVLVAARYSEEAAERLVRNRVPGLAPSRDGWDAVVTLRRECGLLPSPEPRWDDVVDARFLAA